MLLFEKLFKHLGHVLDTLIQRDILEAHEFLSLRPIHLLPALQEPVTGEVAFAFRALRNEVPSRGISFSQNIDNGLIWRSIRRGNEPFSIDLGWVLDDPDGDSSYIAHVDASAGSKCWWHGLVFVHAREEVPWHLEGEVEL